MRCKRNSLPCSTTCRMCQINGCENKNSYEYGKNDENDYSGKTIMVSCSFSKTFLETKRTFKQQFVRNQDLLCTV